MNLPSACCPIWSGRRLKALTTYCFPLLMWLCCLLPLYQSVALTDNVPQSIRFFLYLLWLIYLMNCLFWSYLFVVEDRDRLAQWIQKYTLCWNFLFTPSCATLARGYSYWPPYRGFVLNYIHNKFRNFTCTTLPAKGSCQGWQGCKRRWQSQSKYDPYIQGYSYCTYHARYAKSHYN